ncbi:hypothetical protein [Streptomyces sp. NPDC004528]|uniref:hypothetical protein n=1 Tax=Streptomyces sp. NPDC004528 TaxID=3154550 RepID=UPI0033B6BF74
MTTMTAELVAADHTYDSTEEALNDMFTTPPAELGDACAQFVPSSDTLIIDGRKFYAERVEYAPELDERFVQWVMDNAQEYPVYGDPGQAKPDTVRTWAESVTDKYCGSPYITGWNSQGYESLLHDQTAGMFFRLDGTMYAAIWTHNYGFMQSRPVIFEVSCYESAYLLDDDKAEFGCAKCQDWFEVEGGSNVFKVTEDGERAEMPCADLSEFAADPTCSNCGTAYSVDMSRF